jgi:threonine synthase
VAALDSLDLEEPVVVSTAHPAKFESIVGPLVDGDIEIPDSLMWIRERTGQSVEIDPDLDALRQTIG